MDLERVIQQRASFGAFADRRVPEVVVRALCEAARAAPSAGNLQAWRIVVVRAPQGRTALASAAKQPFVATAPVVLVFFADGATGARTLGDRGRSRFCVQDATIACTFAQLRAADLGLASCWIGAFDDDAVRTAVRAPADLTPVALLPVGFAGGAPSPAPRRPLAELVVDERCTL